MFQPPRLEGRPVSFQFCQQPLSALISPTGEAYIPLAPLCDVLGIAWEAVLATFQDNPIFTFTAKTVRLPQEVGMERQSADLIALPIDMAARWLIDLDDSQVDPELWLLLWKHKEGCYRITLNEYLRFAKNPERMHFKLDRWLRESDEAFSVLYKRGIEHILAREQNRLETAPFATLWQILGSVYFSI